MIKSGTVLSCLLYGVTIPNSRPFTFVEITIVPLKRKCYTCSAHFHSTHAHTCAHTGLHSIRAFKLVTNKSLYVWFIAKTYITKLEENYVIIISMY